MVKRLAAVLFVGISLVVGFTQPSFAIAIEPNPATDSLLIRVDPQSLDGEPLIPSAVPGQENAPAEELICGAGVPVIGENTCAEIDTSGSSSGLLKLFDNIMGGLTRITAAVAITVIVISGIRFATSGGDPQGVAAARGAILYALIALVVAVSTEIIIDFVLRRVS